MSRRRVNSSLNKKHKKITPNSVAETKFLIVLKKEQSVKQMIEDRIDENYYKLVKE